MKKFIALLTASLLASGAMAQMPQQPATGAQKAALENQLQNTLHAKDKGQAMQQAMAVAVLLGCATKQAGKAQTEAFYSRMQVVGKQVEAHCKAQQAGQARGLVLATLQENRTHPVVHAATSCYSTQKPSLDMMAGPELSADIGKYARWAGNPQLAQAEMRDGDICK